VHGNGGWLAYRQQREGQRRAGASGVLLFAMKGSEDVTADGRTQQAWRARHPYCLVGYCC